MTVLKTFLGASLRLPGMLYQSHWNQWYGLCVLALWPMAAHADVINTLTNFLTYLTGDIGKAIAGLAIVGIGFGCFALGRIPKSYVMSVVIGVGIVFGTKGLLTMLSGG